MTIKQSRKKINQLIRLLDGDTKESLKIASACMAIVEDIENVIDGLSDSDEIYVSCIRNIIEGE